MLKNRTIQHPGFEYFETENYNFSSQSNTKSEAMAVGYCAQGPIGEPVRISSISQFINIFGKPENDQEFYLYKGVESVVSKARSIVIIRMPYDNSLSNIIKTDETEVSAIKKYFKVLKGNFAVAKDSTAKYNDLQTAYKNNVTFKTIEFEPDLVSFDDIVKYNSEQFEDDFIIVNKYNEPVSKAGEEYIVSVYGTGNALRHQSLSHNVIDPTPINYFKLTNGVSSIFDENQETKLTYAKKKVFWQTNGDVNTNDEALTVADSYFNECVQYIPTISTYEDFINENIPGIPSATVEFYTDKMVENVVGTEEDYDTLFDNHEPVKSVIINYNDSDAPSFAPLTFDLNGARIEVVNVSKETDYENETLWYMNCEYRLNFYGDNGKLTRSYPLKFIQSTEYGKNYKWKISLKEQFARAELTEEQIKQGLGEYVYYVDQDVANTITVVVSKISPSNFESGRYVFEPVEVFSGSIFKGSVNRSLQQSNYIGDIINFNSNIISFYGKKEYEDYDSSKDSILVEQTTPYRFSVINDGRINTKSEDVFNLEKIIIKQKSLDNGASLDEVLNEMLSKVRNSIVYTYRDVYDFGLTSVLTYCSKNVATDEYYYEPSRFISTELNDTSFLNIGLWKRFVKAFTRHCQYNHKYSMFHADGPRKLVLNGNLSRTGDLKQDPLNIVITGKKAQVVSIRDSSYGETNIQWLEVYNDINYNNTWIPASIKTANSITGNDIINNVWDAPAGHRYGVISDYIRLAINPGYDMCDRLYSNCLNYSIMWPNGTTTIEGQKTQLIDVSALNRINVRRLMIYLERYAQSVSVKYLYQPNTSFTREHIVNDLDSEFSRIKSIGGLYSYRIVCNSENNPPQVIDNNELRISILLQPAKTLEFIVAQFVITKTGVNLEEVDAATF